MPDEPGAGVVQSDAEAGFGGHWGKAARGEELDPDRALGASLGAETDRGDDSGAGHGGEDSVDRPVDDDSEGAEPDEGSEDPVEEMTTTISAP